MTDKMPNTRAETPEEVQYRLDGEKRCRAIADIARKMLPETTGFLLLTATVGGSGEPFQHTSYVSTFQRDDAERLLNEFLDYWREGENRFTEPTVKTATFLRERVYGIIAQSNATPADIVRALHADAQAALDIFPSEAWAAEHTEEECRTRARECVIHAMTAAVSGLALYQSFSMMERAVDADKRRQEAAS
jgi:hypothetical protein